MAGEDEIYIPLCFYFIQTAFGMNYIRNFHLHSIMLLLYRTATLREDDIGLLFTFHYASTLSQPDIVCDGHFYIYIPLCFYFIINYNMACIRTIFIYIPLCFYFIKLLKDCMTTVGFIYIPLCFYFIKMTELQPGSTGHIYIPLCFYFILQELMNSTTFTNLHSIMLLLYLSLYFEIKDSYV